MRNSPGVSRCPVPTMWSTACRRCSVAAVRRRQRSGLPASRSRRGASRGPLECGVPGPSRPMPSCSMPRRARPRRNRATRARRRASPKKGSSGCWKSPSPAISEDDLAAELKWHSRSLGAEDNFLLLCAGPHNRAVAAVAWAASCSRATSSSPRSRRAIAANSRRSAVRPYRQSAKPEPERKIRAGGRGDECRHRRGQAGRENGGGLPRHQYRAGGARLRRILLSAVYPSPWPWPRLRLDPSRRCRARQRNRADPAWCS